MIINNKPLGAICIAPVMIAKVLQNMGRSGTLTGGFDNKISSDIESMGVSIQKVDAKSIVVDYKNKILSTPAYVETKFIKEVNERIMKRVNQLLKMIYSYLSLIVIVPWCAFRLNGIMPPAIDLFPITFSCSTLIFKIMSEFIDLIDVVW